MRGQVRRNVLQIGWFMGVLLLLGALSGCSLFLPEGIKDLTNSDRSGSSSGWLVAAQGQSGPPGCVEELSPGQAKKAAERLISTKQEAKLLKQALERRGKRLQLGKAHGCKVKAHSKVAGQGLFALEETEAEATLIEVPAGTDAALYLFESLTGDGNEWASIREAAADGERLIHLEVGLEDEAGVEGLEDSVGEMSLFLPDDTGIQEVAADLQQLLLGDSGASGAGVRALEAGGYDWAMAEVILDDSRVIVGEDGSEELEAVLVVPEAGTSGELLWDQTRPMIDEGRALYATVKVKRTAPAGSTTRRTLKVTTPPAQVKRGSELRFEPFDLCPYRHYGRVAAFRRALCYKWERQARPKVQKVTLDRTIRNLPSIHSRMPTATSQSPKIMGVVGKDRGLLVYNPKNLGSDELRKLFDATASGAAALSEEGQVEGQQLYELLKIFLDFIKDLVQLWQQMSKEERDAFVHVLSFLYDRPSIRSDMESLYGTTTPEGRAFTKVIDGIVKALEKLSRDHTRQEAYEIMELFIVNLKDKVGLLLEIVDKAGVVGIIAFVKLVEAQQYADAKYIFPKDIIGFFEKVFLQLKSILDTSWSLFLEHLAAAAAQASAKAGMPEGEAALEMIARLYLLQDLFLKMHARGWGILTYGYSMCGLEPGSCAYFDFRARKEFNVSGIGDYPWHVFGWVEPYLSLGDIDRILQQIENAANWVFKVFINPATGDPLYLTDKTAIVQVINNSESGAVEALCGRLGFYGTPVVIIAGGQVACYSGISEQGAQDICKEMGYCNSSSDSQDGASGDPPEGTYSVPMGDPYTGLCPPGYTFCMI